ncbi:UL20 virion protein (membrane) [Bovine alphaherpesvirus 5]|uniref:UL20 virion protein (Membrane) n=1 Tax=Bovine alphaherpesvirus 5 TaxID=35244 RepID=Q6X231_9ALPH|nr:UL20 virion protein (membrane) [Bovine alphaherpesvirus 5]AAR86142.1 UL20 virion protein (membrane) [Bovine alphaherpesvirus 5]QVY10572.1 UL20 membrane virion protein [Bovine alphaherpesvirus 5]UHJ15464.1 UL20 virion protein [Bovine alphaherpesvirus 5]UHJ15537.1 UL20 virion protein [Bovine alphaherpesvirus 5]
MTQKGPGRRVKCGAYPRRPGVAASMLGPESAALLRAPELPLGGAEAEEGAAGGGASDGEGEEDELLRCVALSAYGGDVDFLTRSPRLAPRADGRPAFSAYVVFGAASAFGLNPACCLLFLYYYRTFGDATFAAAGAAATLAYYARLAAAAGFLYAGVRADRLPFGRWPRALLAALVLARAAVFAAVALPAAFAGPALFLRLSAAAADGGARAAAGGLLLAGLAAYTADLVCDVIGFFAPRAWMRVCLGGHVAV